MVKMDLGSSTSQASSTSSMTSSRISAYQGLLASLQNFSGTGDLKGSAYDSAKAYASSVIVPLIQGAILLSEGIANSTANLPSQYSSNVASESLDSDVLEQQIASYQSAYNQANEWLNRELNKKVLVESNVLRAEMTMSRHLAKIQELQEKLNKLIAFDGTSSRIFDNIDSLSSAVSQGLSQVKGGFSSFNGTFSLPAKENMAWATTITSAWEEREKVIASLQSPNDLTQEEIARLSDYVGAGGSITGDKEILLYNNYYGYTKYTFSIIGSSDGKVNLSYSKDGLDGVSTDFGNISKSGNYSTSQSLNGSAFQDQLKGSNNYTVPSNGFQRLSTSLSSGNTKTEFGFKYVNGTLAAYNKEKTTISAASVKGTNVDITASFEQGNYIRNNNGPHLSQVDYLVDDIGEFAEEHPVFTGVVTGVVVATVAYFAWPIVVGSGLVEAGSLAIGTVAGTVSTIWNFISNGLKLAF